MKKITKEMCMAYITDQYKSIPLFLLTSIFAIVAVWVFTKNVIAATILVVLMPVAIFFIINRNKKIKNINSIDFYLVEDAVADFHKKFSPDRGGGSGRNYIYTFRDHGEYTIHKSVHPTIEIPLHKEKNISHLAVEKLCLTSCETGDQYYLLIAKEKERTKIIKCFPKYHFDIAPEDFNCIDGKYYCKK